MSFLNRKICGFPIGIWIALAALMLAFLGWVMQGYSLLDWEGAVKLGLQNSSFKGDAVEQVLANKERGEAIADLLWPLPIFVIAIIGILKKKIIGFTAAMMEFAICIYFPLFYTFQIWHTYKMTVIAALFLWAIPSILGILGLWTNRNFFLQKHKEN